MIAFGTKVSYSSRLRRVTRYESTPESRGVTQRHRVWEDQPIPGERRGRRVPPARTTREGIVIGKRHVHDGIAPLDGSTFIRTGTKVAYLVAFALHLAPELVLPENLTVKDANA